MYWWLLISMLRWLSSAEAVRLLGNVRNIWKERSERSWWIWAWGNPKEAPTIGDMSSICWCLAGNFREWSIITSHNHPSNPQQPIHSLRLAPVSQSLGYNIYRKPWFVLKFTVLFGITRTSVTLAKKEKPWKSNPADCPVSMAILVMYTACRIYITNLGLMNRSSGEISLAAPSLGKELHSDERFAGTQVGVASRCDEPAWGRECLQKFMVQVGKWRMVGLRWLYL